MNGEDGLKIFLLFSRNHEKKEGDEKMVEKREIEMINDLTDILPDEFTKEDSERLQEIVDYLEWSEIKKREKLYSYFITSIVQYFIGIDDELQKIKIYGKNDKGEPYIITIK
jgi:hypothetical protein